jgi:tetratricopeptide (TPR) repeat protein
MASGRLIVQELRHPTGGTRSAAARRMREFDESPHKYAWIVYAIATMMFGAIAGYIIAVQAGRGASAPVVTAQNAATDTRVQVVDDTELRAYRDILARDPKNAQAAVKAGNLLYDAHRYPEAIEFYKTAFALLPGDINVSTDLGTALWYSGRADEALTQYEKSLAIDAAHAQTLFNVGVVRADGKRDYTGAIAAWETLLKKNPAYSDSAKVRTLIADARAKM